MGPCYLTIFDMSNIALVIIDQHFHHFPTDSDSVGQLEICSTHADIAYNIEIYESLVTHE